MKRTVISLVGFLLLISITVPSAWAAGWRAGQDIIIEEGQTVDDDLYVSAERVVVNGVIKGDLIGAAQQITINGTVEGDLIAAAQVISINGQVGDDARVAGMVITVGKGASIGDDLLAGCYSLELKPGSVVRGELRWGSNQALLAGEISGDVHGGTSAVRISGQIGGDVVIDLGEKGGGPPPAVFSFFPGGAAVPFVPPGLKVTDEASIGGSLTYTSAEEGDISPQAQIAGGVSRKAPAVRKQAAKPSIGSLPWFLGRLRYFVSLLAVGFLLAWLAPRYLNVAAEGLKAKPLPGFGWGAVIAIGVPLAGLLFGGLVMFISIVMMRLLGKLGTTFLLLGALLDGGLLLLFFIGVAYVSKVIVGLLAGRFILGRIWPSRAGGLLWPLTAGVLAFVILNSIPYLGTLVWLVTVIPGLGAIWMAGQTALKKPAS